uniref:Uncharacterized protein n=1 Tax=Anguilla anguilla TaxID=7936 RepID=A0A0E9RZS3_ANGAN
MSSHALSVCHRARINAPCSQRRGVHIETFNDTISLVIDPLSIFIFIFQLI